MRLGQQTGNKVKPSATLRRLFKEGPLPLKKKIMELQFTALELGRPYMLAEGVPADRVTALRRAFDAAMKDKDLLADAEKQGLEINPVPGEEMQRILTQVYDTPKALIDRLAEAAKDTTGLKQLPAAEKK